MTSEKQIFSDEEAERLLLQFIEGKGGVSEEEGQELFEWAHKVRLQNAALELILSGEVRVLQMKDGQPLLSREVAA